MNPGSNGGSYLAPESVGKIGRIGLVAGVAGLVLLAVGFATNKDQFFRSYLTGYMWMLGLVGRAPSASCSSTTSRAGPGAS